MDWRIAQRHRTQGQHDLHEITLIIGIQRHKPKERSSSMSKGNQHLHFGVSVPYLPTARHIWMSVLYRGEFFLVEHFVDLFLGHTVSNIA
jgi:hypothetical protein